MNIQNYLPLPSYNLETVFSDGKLSIYSIPLDTVRTVERWMAYKKSFVTSARQHLGDFDSTSLHFEIWDDSGFIGGFRLSPIANGNSEVEEVFKGFSFTAGSFELGRLWVSTNGIGDGKRCMMAVNDWLTDKNTKLYFKQSSALGEVSKQIGAVSEGVSQWNPRLKYQCELFSWRSDHGHR